VNPWSTVEADAPDLAARVRAVFDAGTNKTIATIRADGSPRISGTELSFDGGRVTLGMMPGSRKLADVRRDSRVAVHSPTLEPPAGSLGAGDAKLAGRLVEFVPEQNPVPGAAHFEVDLTEVALTSLNAAGDRLVIESWHPGRGYERVERE